MAGREHPVYCAQCGSIVAAGDNFCGVCGARVSPSALESAPTQQMPTPSYAPPRASGGNSRALPLILGLAAVLLVLIGIGTIVGFALVGGGATNAPQSSANEPAPAEDPEPTQQDANESTEDSQPPTEQELGVGDSVELEGIEATLNEVRILPTTDLDQPIQNPDNRFLAADLTFENVSEEAVSVSSLLEFVLKNEEGYSASQTVHTQQRELAEGEIAPGETANGEIVYEVPPSPAASNWTTGPSPAAAPTPGPSATCKTSPPSPGPRSLGPSPPRPPPQHPSPRAAPRPPPRPRSPRRPRTTTRPSTAKTGPTPTQTSTLQPGPSTPKTSGTSRTSSSPTQRGWNSPR